MRALLRWLFRQEGREEYPLRRLGSAYPYRSATRRPLLPSQVRLRRFTPVGFGRRGVDPDEVTEFLEQVAADLARAYAELAGVREQNARIKDALRRWQSRQVSTAHGLARR
ncbi:DivIVA domain-containing protein [Plantactinospora sp. KLBMP9567]|uniref:DivIVA domain-containing protein n=1 Tax=Plantactinospora sp. KLBMP9567 TaxID=3085900 RepID=UPI002981164B|nr:DivIVA domain-containing protein [Plantactinospora sp. KLBMP9567]MDW5329057.1 DivIVA domain-containing protein [Plantactinospora sp. KLBMP9567]